MESTTDKLKEYLKQTGLSVVQLAKDTDIPQDRIYSWLRGKGNPKATDQMKLEKLMIIGKSPNEEKPADKPQAHVSEQIPDPQIPGIYQSIVLELIESSKAQREISKALLEERELIRDTAHAAIKLANKTNELAEIKASLDEMRKDLAGTQGVVWGIQQFAVEQLAIVRGIPEDDAADLLDSAITGLDIGGKKSKKGAVSK